MQVWVGLGNPGPQYALHRHNVGFMVMDTLAEVHGFGPVQKKFQGWVQEGRIGGQKVLLLKPATFMNESGRAVGEALRFYKLGTEALTVFHDELDLAPFKVKVRVGGGLAGHNGLRSIDQHLGPDFRRVRIGIGHPGHKAEVANYFAVQQGLSYNDAQTSIAKGIQIAAAITPTRWSWPLPG